MINQERKAPCVTCGGTSHHDHHLIHRSQEPGLQNEDWIKIRLCAICHHIWHNGTAREIYALRFFYTAVARLKEISHIHYERFKTRMAKGGVLI